MRCERCGHEQQEGRFCGRCGAQVSPPASGTVAHGDDTPGRAEGESPPARTDDGTGTDPFERPRRERLRRLAASLGAAAVLGAVAVWLAGPLGDEADEVILPDEATEERDPEDEQDDDSDEGGRGSELQEPVPEDGAEPASFTCEAGDCGWRAGLDDVVGDASHTGGMLQAASDDLLIVAGRRTLAGLDPEGQRQWKRELEQSPHRIDTVVPTADGGLLLLSLGGRELVVLEAASGQRRWSQDTGPESRYLHSATVVGSLLLVALQGSTHGYDDGPAPQTVRAHDLDTGEVVWERSADAALLGGGAVVLLDEALQGLDPDTGETRWRNDTVWSPPEPDPDEMFGPTNTVRLAGGDLLVVDGRASVAADGITLLDVATGEPVHHGDGRVEWTAHPAAVSGPTRVVVREPSGDLVARDVRGEPVWRHSREIDGTCCARVQSRFPPALLPPPVQSTDPSSSSLLLVAPGGEQLLTLDVADGSTRHRGTVNAEGRIAGLLGPRTVLMRRQQSFAAVDILDGGVRWRSHRAWPQSAHGHALLLVEDTLVGIPVEGGERRTAGGDRRQEGAEVRGP